MVYSTRYSNHTGIKIATKSLPCRSDHPPSTSETYTVVKTMSSLAATSSVFYVVPYVCILNGSWTRLFVFSVSHFHPMDLSVLARLYHSHLMQQRFHPACLCSPRIFSSFPGSRSLVQFFVAMQTRLFSCTAMYGHTHIAKVWINRVSKVANPARG